MSKKTKKHKTKSTGKRSKQKYSYEPLKKGLLIFGALVALNPSGDIGPRTIARNVERQKVLNITESWTTRCYDIKSASQSADCGSFVRNMLQEIDSVAQLNITGNVERDLEKLKRYFKRHMYLFSPSVTLKGQRLGYDGFLAPIRNQTREKMTFAEGEREIDILYLDSPIINSYMERLLSSEEISASERVVDGQVCVRNDTAASYVDELMKAYSTVNLDRTLHTLNNSHTLSAARRNLLQFYKELGLILLLHEWKDYFDAVRGNRSKLARAFLETHAIILKYHGARHVLDEGKGYSNTEEEKRCKLEEFHALNYIPLEYSVQGYSILGNAVHWSIIGSQNHANAGADVLNYFIGYILNNPKYFPQIQIPQDKNLITFALPAQLYRLTGEQIRSIAGKYYNEIHEKK